MKRLIVNGDDFGHATGINRGILHAHHKGIVTSTTVMVNYPAAPAGLEEALTTAPDLGIGLHFTLTSGCPVLPADQIPSLVREDGRLLVLGDWRTQFEKIDPEDVRREMTAQFDRFISLTGQRPDHLDSHHHFTYLLPVAFKTMLDISAQYHLPMRHGPFSFTPEEATAAPIYAFPGLPPEAAGRIYERLHDIFIHYARPNWPARFVIDFYDTHATLGDLLLILTHLEPDSLTEIMCHPGYMDDELASIYAAKREDEIAHLTHAATLECVKAEEITLITYQDIDHEQTA